MTLGYLILDPKRGGTYLKLFPDGRIADLYDPPHYLTRAKIEAAKPYNTLTIHNTEDSGPWDVLTLGPCSTCDGDGFVIARQFERMTKGLRGGPVRVYGYDDYEDGELPSLIHASYVPTDCDECNEDGEWFVPVAEGVGRDGIMGLFEKGNE